VPVGRSRIGVGSGRICADADEVTDDRTEGGGTGAEGSGGFVALEHAMHELVSAIGEDTQKGRRSRKRPPDDQAAEAKGDARARAKVQAEEQSPDSSRAGRVRRTLRVHRTRVMLVTGTLLTLLIVATVLLTSSGGPTGDIALQSCAVHGSNVEATVVVTNQGIGTASYLFDVVFSQDQSPVFDARMRVSDLRSGKSETLHADSGSLDTSTTPTCAIKNQRRLAAG